MDRPRTVLGWIVRVLALALCVFAAGILILIAFQLTSNFISPDSGDGFGNAGGLILAVLALVFAGPFIALIIAMGLPMISDDPRFRGAGR